MSSIQGYLAVAGAGGIVALMGYGWTLKASVATLTAEKTGLVAELATCSARTTNLIEDGVSDAEIDNIPDSDLSIIPDRWLLPETP